ncbi:MAG: glycosyltransferase family 4 protein [Phycisphaeraceae bacterium]|nr:glycosyltransferase family 4 protein [Phycisphaeraceae bacterium]
MRILLIHHGFTGGGAERYTREMSLLLRERGHDVEVWIADPQPNLPDWVVPIRTPIERKLYTLDVLPDLTDERHRGSIRKLRQAPGRFDVAHLNHLGGGWMSIRAAAQLCRAMPTVWMHHDEWAATNGFICGLEGKISRQETAARLGGLRARLGYSPYHDTFKSRRLGRWLDRTAPQPTLHLCPSDHMANMIRQCGRYSGATIQRIRHGTGMLVAAQEPMDQAQARQTLGLPQDRPVVLMLAANATDVHKGLDLGLEAVRQSRKQVDAHVLLLGQGAEKVRTQARDLPMVTGFASTEAELAAAYQAADLTLIPSLGECFPYVAIESLACRRPVVAFAVGGLVESVQEDRHGKLIPCFDTKAMSQGIVELLQSPQQCHLRGLAGRAWVETHCTMVGMVDQTLDAYRHAMARFAGKQAGNTP